MLIIVEVGKYFSFLCFLMLYTLISFFVSLLKLTKFLLIGPIHVMVVSGNVQ